MKKLRRLITKAGRKVELMHGTNSSVIESVLQTGLMPVGLTGNAMFNYNDYGRKGEPKHPECIYLTDDLTDALRYSANAVKHNEGFPVVLKVKVDSDDLTWDDDAFYKSYGKFDFGEKDPETGEWIRKPKKEYWKQSLDINMQCSHYGRIPPSQFVEVYLNGRWFDIEDFTHIYNEYKKIQIEALSLHENNRYIYKEYKITSLNTISFILTIVNRNVYFRNLEFESELDKYQEQALSTKIMEFTKNKLGEFGATVYYDPSFRKINFNPKVSCFNYVFGAFKIINSEDAYKEISDKLTERERLSDEIEAVIKGTATYDQFDDLYEYNVDFIGDIVNYCRNVLEYNKGKTIEVLQGVKKKYNDAYDQIEAEIEVLEKKK